MVRARPAWMPRTSTAGRNFSGASDGIALTPAPERPGNAHDPAGTLQSPPEPRQRHDAGDDRRGGGLAEADRAGDDRHAADDAAGGSSAGGMPAGAHAVTVRKSATTVSGRILTWTPSPPLRLSDSSAPPPPVLPSTAAMWVASERGQATYSCLDVLQRRQPTRRPVWSNT